MLDIAIERARDAFSSGASNRLPSAAVPWPI